MRRTTMFPLVLAFALSMNTCGGNGDDGGQDARDVPAGDTAVSDTPQDVSGQSDLDQDVSGQNDVGQDTGGETLTQAQLYLESDELAQQIGAALPAANMEFAVKMFQKLNEGEGADKNLFISPLSISTALSMVYNGATGATQQAMAETLGYTGIDMAELDAAWLALIKSLENVDEDLVLAIADSIWMDEQFAPAVKSVFLDAMVQFFESELFTIDFQGPDALEEINGWIEDNTNGKIKDMIDQIPADVVMYLINALYFKANWLYPFDPEDTTQQDFTLADGSKKPVDMMKFPKLVTSFKFTADVDYCAVRLPYGRDKVAFYGFIPWSWDSDKTVEDFIADMTAAKLETYIADVAYPEGDGAGISVWLPRFKIEYKKTLNDALKALGMGPAFTGGFDDIAPGIGISRVIHQTFIEVNEEGTEAAAATVVEMFSGITPNFIATQPFFFLIRDDRSGTILFMGKVADPANG